MKRNDKIFKQAAALILAAFLCFVQAGCGCNQAMEESSSSPGAGPSAGAVAGDTDREPATSSTEGVNQMTTPENGTTTANGTEDMTHSAGAVGGGTAEGESDGMQEESSLDGAGTAAATESSSIE